MPDLESEQDYHPSKRTWIVGTVRYQCGHAVEKEVPSYGELLNERFVAEHRNCDHCQLERIKQHARGT